MRLGLALLMVACSSPAPKPKPIPVVQRFTNDLDVLFVIDNSPGMMEKQTTLLDNSPRFFESLDEFPGGRPNLHVGVVDSTVDIGAHGWAPACPSPDVADNGLLQNTPRVSGCKPPLDRYIVDVASTGADRTTNYTGTLDTALSCIGNVGTSGCEFEAPLEAMKRALDGSRAENAGFTRDTANLLVTILTDQDDCSVKDPSLFALPGVGAGDFRCQPLYAYDCDPAISATMPGTYNDCAPKYGSYLVDPGIYVNFLQRVRPEQRVGIALIAGDIPRGADGQPSIQTDRLNVGGDLALHPSCSAVIAGNTGLAYPSIRLASVVNLFNADGREYTICQSDYGSPLADIGGLAKRLMSPCFASDFDITDTDDANAGAQPSCTVSYSDGTNTTDLQPCMMADATTPANGNGPCWWVTSDASCGTPTNLAFHSNQPLTLPGTSLEVSCLAPP